LVADGLSLYVKPGWKWAVFDTIVVCFQILDEMTQLLFVGTAMQEIIESLGILRLLRLGRVVRLIRMVRLIPELKSMVYLIAASMGSFVWTMVLLILMIYCVAVYFTELANDIARKSRGDLREDIIKNWGSVLTSILSLFQAITGGDDWRNFIDVFKGDSTFGLNAIVFCVYIAFGTLVMLNLVTGVFVEGAQRITKEDKDQFLIKSLQKFFNICDDDASFTLSYQEFKDHLESNGMEAYFKAADLDKKDARQMFKLLDTSGQKGDAGAGSHLTIEEFVSGCMRLKGPARSVDLAALSYDFHVAIESQQRALQKVMQKLDKVQKHMGKLEELA
jgi:hypothetical protein